MAPPAEHRNVRSCPVMTLSGAVIVGVGVAIKYKDYLSPLGLETKPGKMRSSSHTRTTATLSIDYHNRSHYPGSDAQTTTQAHTKRTPTITCYAK